MRQKSLIKVKSDLGSKKELPLLQATFVLQRLARFSQVRSEQSFYT